MKCPWQTVATKHAPTKDGVQEITVTFGDCLNAECPFFHLMGHTYGADGEPVEVTRCTRTDTTR